MASLSLKIVFAKILVFVWLLFFVVSQMAMKKLVAKRARKVTAREGSSTTPQVEIEFAGHRFRSEEHQGRFEVIKDWSFLKERRVHLAKGEYVEFQVEVARRRWTQLTEPMAKYDPEVVMEFYANTCPIKEGVMDRRSRVRGQWIPYDRDAINQFLGHPLVLEERQRCEYAERRSQFSGFDEEVIGQLLCSLGHDFARSVVGRQVRIIRTSMTTLTQIRMLLLLSNILPNDHNFDLSLPKCQLIYSIMTQISVHVAQLISDAIHQFIGIAPPRHLVDPEKSNTTLGFLALFRGLCQFYRVLVAPTKLIWPPINRSFIEKYCMPRQAQQPGQDQ